jgi:hypothetical protein
MPRPSDLSVYLGRWCSASVEHDIAHFASSWGLDLYGDRLETHRRILRARRMRVIRPVRNRVHRVFGDSVTTWLEDVVEPVFDRFCDVEER